MLTCINSDQSMQLKKNAVSNTCTETTYLTIMHKITNHKDEENRLVNEL